MAGRAIESILQLVFQQQVRTSARDPARSARHPVFFANETSITAGTPLCMRDTPGSRPRFGLRPAIVRAGRASAKPRSTGWGTAGSGRREHGRRGRLLVPAWRPGFSWNGQYDLRSARPACHSALGQAVKSAARHRLGQCRRTIGPMEFLEARHAAGESRPGSRKFA